MPPWEFSHLTRPALREARASMRGSRTVSNAPGSRLSGSRGRFCFRGVGGERGVRLIVSGTREGTTMATKQSLRVLFGMLVISAWALGSAMQAGAETLNYKSYVWMNRNERVLVEDVEGHSVSLAQRGGSMCLTAGR